MLEQPIEQSAAVDEFNDSSGDFNDSFDEQLMGVAKQSIEQVGME